MQAALVFSAKHRRNVFTREMTDQLREIFSETCPQMECHFQKIR
ncbi:transposase [Endozoicomonas gorgoniicola]